MKKFFFVLVLLICAAGAAAQDLVSGRAILEDPSGQLSLSEVKGATFTPTGEVTLRSFGSSVFWLRLSVDVPRSQEPLALSIRPSLIDRLTLFTPPATVAEDGTTVDMNTRSAQAKTLIRLAPGLQTVYLRVETNGFFVHPVIQTQQSLAQENFRGTLVFGGVIAAYALMILTLLTLKKIRRSSLQYCLLLHITVCLWSYVSMSDISLLIFDEDAAWTIRHAQLLSALCIWSFLLVLQSFLSFAERPLLRRACQWLLGSCVLLSAIVYAVVPQDGFRAAVLVNLYVLLALSLGLIGAYLKFLRTTRTRQLPELFAFGLMILVLMVTSWSVLQFTGVVQVTPLLLQIATFRPLVFTVCLMVFLWNEEAKKGIEQHLSQLKLRSVTLLAELKSQQLEAQKTFTGLLMHELKSPLYTIQLAALSLGKNGNLKQDDAKRLNNINRSADDICHIVDTCVQAERLELGALPVKMFPVEISSLLHEILPPVGQDRIALSGLTRGKVNADFQYVRIVLTNLISNALKYSPPDSTVEVSVQADSEAVVPSLRFRVSNTVGSAGRPDPLKVFTRYYRGPGSENVAGSGLGLWLAHDLAVKLNTQLQCSSDDSTVNFYFSLELC